MLVSKLCSKTSSHHISPHAAMATMAAKYPRRRVTPYGRRRSKLVSHPTEDLFCSPLPSQLHFPIAHHSGFHARTQRRTRTRLGSETGEDEAGQCFQTPSSRKEGLDVGYDSQSNDTNQTTIEPSSPQKGNHCEYSTPTAAKQSNERQRKAEVLLPTKPNMFSRVSFSCAPASTASSTPPFENRPCGLPPAITQVRDQEALPVQSTLSGAGAISSRFEISHDRQAKLDSEVDRRNTSFDDETMYSDKQLEALRDQVPAQTPGSLEFPSDPAIDGRSEHECIQLMTPPTTSPHSAALEAPPCAPKSWRLWQPRSATQINECHTTGDGFEDDELHASLVERPLEREKHGMPIKKRKPAHAANGRRMLQFSA